MSSTYTRFPVQGSSPSIGTNNQPAPGSSTEIGFIDSSGNLQGVSPSNPLPVDIHIDSVTVSENLAQINGATVNVGTGASSTGTQRIAVASDSTIGVSSLPSIPAGSNNIGSITNVTGTVSLPNGASTAANQTNGTQKSQIVDSLGTVISASGSALNVNVFSGSVTNPAIGPNASTAPTSSIQIGAVNPAGLLQPLQSDVNKYLITNTSNGATSANQTTLGSQTTKINDGTNSAVIKAASTAAAATDTALVVAISPNNSVAITASTLPLPSGAATAANQTSIQSSPGSSASTAVTIQGSVSGVAVPVSGTVSVSGVATAANQTTLGNQTTKLNDGTYTATIKGPSQGPSSSDSSLVVSVSPNTQDPALGGLTGGSSGSKSYAVGGIYNSAGITLTNGNQSSLQLDSAGNLKITGSISASNPSVGTTGSTAPTSATEIGGVYNSSLPTLTNGQMGAAQLDASSRLLIAQPTASALNATVSIASAQTLSTVTTVGAVTAITNALPAGTNNIGLVSTGGSTGNANAPVYNAYTSTSITTAAYTQLIASTTSATNKVTIFDSSGQAMILATGASGSEVILAYIPPGGVEIPVQIPASTRIAYKALTANATSGYLLLNLWK